MANVPLLLLHCYILFSQPIQRLQHCRIGLPEAGLLCERFSLFPKTFENGRVFLASSQVVGKIISYLLYVRVPAQQQKHKTTQRLGTNKKKKKKRKMK